MVGNAKEIMVLYLPYFLPFFFSQLGYIKYLFPMFFGPRGSIVKVNLSRKKIQEKNIYHYQLA